MFGIMKKDWLFYAGFLSLLPLQLIYWYTTRMQLDTTVVFMMTGWIHIVIVGSIFSVEMNETKNRGYSFLATLPVTAREIVAAKLIPILILVGIYFITGYFAFSSLEVETVYLDFSRKWLLFNATFSLCVAGAVYWFIFRYGLEKAVYLIAVLFSFALLVPIALNEAVLRGYLDDSSSVFMLARSTANGYLALAGAAVYLAFYHISVRVFERRIPT